MRVALLSWEFPPRMVGELAGYVKELALSLVKKNVETHVVTYHDYLVGEREEEGIATHRVTDPIRTHIGVLTWVLTLNQEIERVVANIYYKSKRRVDLIDAHDWHFIHAAVTLKNAFGVPFIYSVESLEEHRSQGAGYPFNLAVKSIEWLGLFEAKRVIAKSTWMRDEIVRLYRVPAEKIGVVTPSSESWMKGILKNYEIAMGDEAST